MKNRTFHIVTLGCPKNQVDSENIAALLLQEGFRFAESVEKADVVIVNTCAFIEDARREGIEVILEAAEIKKEVGGFLVVIGCISQRYKEEIAEEIPEVDAWMGLEDLAKIVPLVKQLFAGKKENIFYGDPPLVFQDLPRLYSTPENYGYLKIAEGCNHTCGFCVIPSIRGKYRSLPMERVVEEANNMVKSGRREIILIAQDTTIYGADIYGKGMLSELLLRLCDIEDLKWLRLMYAYPSSLSEDVLKVMASQEKICKYVDIPLQHSHPDVLKKMKRPFGEAHTRGVMEKIREYLPDGAVRSAFIVGHPGETEKRFMHLANFIEEMKFYNLGIFTFSPEEGTPSGGCKSRPSLAEAARRRDFLMEMQQEISLNLRRQLIGKTVKAVCEQVLSPNFAKDNNALQNLESYGADLSQAPESTRALGRTVFDAPEIDGLLYITGKPPAAGAYFQAKITDATPYDLIGEKI